MPCYNYISIFVFVYSQLVELFIYLIAEAGIDGRPCRIFYAASLKAWPEVPHEEFTKS